MNVSSFRGWIAEGLRSDVGDENGAVVSTSAFREESLELESFPLKRVDTDVSSYESGSDYQKESSLDIKGSIDIGIASASGRYTQVKNLVRTSNSSVVRADIEVEHSSWMLRTAELKLSDDAVQILTTPPPLPNATAEELGAEIERLFRAKYGDYFCSGVTLGGYLDTNMILESSASKSTERKALTVKVKVLFVKKTYSESSFKENETKDVRLSLVVNDSTAGAGMSFEGKPGAVVLPGHLTDIISNMSDRIELFVPRLYDAVEQGIGATNRERSLLGAGFDRNLVMYYQMTPFVATTEYRTLREIAVQRSVLRQESVRFYAIEVAYINSIMSDLRNAASDRRLEGDEVDPSVIRNFDEVEVPRVSQLPESFELHEEFWKLDLNQTFLSLAEEGE